MTSTPGALRAREGGEDAGAERPSPLGGSWLDRYFHISARGSTVGREVRGGAVTFLTMAYIVVLNSVLLGGQDAVGNTLSRSGLITSTALAAALATLLMGVVGKLPLALAAGLGVSGVIAAQVAPAVTWSQAMGLCVVYGVVIMLLVVTGLRRLIMDAIPQDMKHAITMGLGLFIALIGLVRAGFVRSHNASAPLEMGRGGELTGWPVAIFCVTLLIIFALQARNVPGGILLGLVCGTVLAVLVHQLADLGPAAWGGAPPELHGSALAWPDVSLVGHVDLGWGALGSMSVSTVGTLVLAAFFSGAATMIGVGAEAGLVDERGRIPRMREAQLLDGAGGALGGALGASGQGVFIESAAGVGEGARTGLASVVTSLGFVGCLFAAPLTQLIPGQVAAAALVVIGALMMSSARHVAWADRSASIPAFLTLALIPFTYSITAGVGAGVISYTAIKAAQGKWREPGVFMWLLAIVFLLYFAARPVGNLLGATHEH